MTDTETKRVFISYSADSDEHKDNILKFSDELRGGGIDCMIDQYIQNPPEGWPKWMDRQIEDSDFIVVVCTKQYMDKYSGNILERGLGVKFESYLIAQKHVENASLNTKFIPVVFSEDEKQYILSFLKSSTHYLVDLDDLEIGNCFPENGITKLYRYLTNQPEVSQPKIGMIKSLPSKRRFTNPR